MITSPNLRLFNSGRGAQDSGTSYSSFQHIGVQATAICRRYGTWTAAPVTCPTNPPGTTNLYSNSPSIGDFVRKGQALNYEAVRAHFEAYINNSTRTDSPSTGLVYWMMNKPMPSLLWNLYNYDYDQSGTYFGAKKANSPLHVYYSYAAPENDPGNRMVNVVNQTGRAQNDLTVSARTVDMAGKQLDQKGGLEHQQAEPGRDERALPGAGSDACGDQRRAAADVLPRAAAQARHSRDRPQRLLALHRG
jgi:exo-1,4-beta-D-glucosaminidase